MYDVWLVVKSLNVAFRGGEVLVVVLVLLECPSACGVEEVIESSFPFSDSGWMKLGAT